MLPLSGLVRAYQRVSDHHGPGAPLEALISRHAKPHARGSYPVVGTSPRPLSRSTPEPSKEATSGQPASTLWPPPTPSLEVATPHVKPSIEEGPKQPLSPMGEGPHITSSNPSLGPPAMILPCNGVAGKPSISKRESALEVRWSSLLLYPSTLQQTGTPSPPKAQDEATIVEDMTVESIAKGEQQIKALRHELKDANRQLGKVNEEKRLLEKQLSTKSDELVATQLAVEEAKGAWKDEKNQASE
ncbi:hypothetical protein GW17_00055326 [Ensete ventricosum]|nr:hypothetical protein GW17_00055326 [Ensete ventricosum]